MGPAVQMISLGGGTLGNSEHERFSQPVSSYGELANPQVEQGLTLDSALLTLVRQHQAEAILPLLRESGVINLRLLKLMAREKDWQNLSPFNAPDTVPTAGGGRESVSVCPQEATGTSAEALISGLSEIRRDLQSHVAVTGFNGATAPTAAGGRDSVSQFNSFTNHSSSVQLPSREQVGGQGAGAGSAVDGSKKGAWSRLASTRENTWNDVASDSFYPMRAPTVVGQSSGLNLPASCEFTAFFNYNLSTADGVSSILNLPAGGVLTAFFNYDLALAALWTGTSPNSFLSERGKARAAGATSGN